MDRVQGIPGLGDLAHLSNIPFQPIDFKGDTVEGVFEDDLIAFAW